MFSERMLANHFALPFLLIMGLCLLVGAVSMKGCEYIGDHYTVKIERKP